MSKAEILKYYLRFLGLSFKNPFYKTPRVCKQVTIFYKLSPLKKHFFASIAADCLPLSYFAMNLRCSSHAKVLFKPMPAAPRVLNQSSIKVLVLIRGQRDTEVACTLFTQQPWLEFHKIYQFDFPYLLGL